jgi:hypothetical protein
MFSNARGRWRHAVAFTALTAASVTAAPMMSADAAGSASRTYSTDTDFAEGTSNNVANAVPGQLQLDDTVTAFPFIWVSPFGPRDDRQDRHRHGAGQG